MAKHAGYARRLAQHRRRRYGGPQCLAGAGARRPRPPPADRGARRQGRRTNPLRPDRRRPIRDQRVAGSRMAGPRPRDPVPCVAPAAGYGKHTDAVGVEAEVRQENEASKGAFLTRASALRVRVKRGFCAWRSSVRSPGARRPPVAEGKGSPSRNEALHRRGDAGGPAPIHRLLTAPPNIVARDSSSAASAANVSRRRGPSVGSTSTTASSAQSAGVRRPVVGERDRQARRAQRACLEHRLAGPQIATSARARASRMISPGSISSTPAGASKSA